MKKLSIPKLRKKSSPEQPHGRITTDTLAEHRERVISEGRRFKYPLQYARHKLVFNAVLISLAALVLLIVGAWWQMYRAHDTSTFFYRISQIAPLPAGSIDGEAIRYSDYLLYYRPSEYYLNKFDEIDANSQDGKLQLEYKKRDAMDRAISDAYARKIAREQNLEVTNEEVDQSLEALKQADNGTLTDEAIRSSAQQVFGMTDSDLRTQYRNSILRSKAAFALDQEATATSEDIKNRIASKKSLESIANTLNKQKKDTVAYGVSGLALRSTVFNGVKVSDIAMAKRDVVSGPLKSLTGEGYLFYRVIAINDREVNFEFLQVPLKTFRENVEALKASGKVNEYIDIDPEKYTEK